jgi:mannan endo-1,4-beta-mannosidase
MVPMVELHEATGETSTYSLVDVEGFWTQPEATQVAEDFREYLLINIANEWNGTSNYLDAYRQAIDVIRGAGLEHPLVIDANGYGQIIPSSGGDRNALINAWFDDAHTLNGEYDNLIFSVHMYGWYPTPDDVSDVLGRDDIGNTLPFIIGEFAYEHSGSTVAWQSIMQQCQDNDIGWISWSWCGNADDVAFMDMATGWEGSLNDWGQNIFTRTNGIEQTA